MAGPQRFFDSSQPQTLQIATFLLYFRAVLLLIGGALIFAVAHAAGAYGMANGKKWGYGLALAAAVLRLVLIFTGPGSSLDFVLRYRTIELMLSVALVALLVHPQSREYQRIWFS